MSSFFKRRANSVLIFITGRTEWLENSNKIILNAAESSLFMCRHQQQGHKASSRPEKT